jgi:hypothetical protein
MIDWRKSSHSGGQNGGMSDCVEVASLAASIGVRDSRAPAAGHLSLSPGAFSALLALLKRDEPSA